MGRGSPIKSRRSVDDLRRAGASAGRPGRKKERKGRGGILNFSRWEARPDPDHPMRYCIEVSDAADFPDTLAWRSDGLVNHMATQHGTPDLWTWTRPRQDLIVFRMTREA